MSEQKPPCVIELFEASNQGVRGAIAEKTVEAGTVNELGQYVVSCERCGVDFGLTAEIGSQIAEMRLLSASSVSEQGCDEAKSGQEGDWVMRVFLPSWFPFKVLHSAKGKGETDGSR